MAHAMPVRNLRGGQFCAHAVQNALRVADGVETDAANVWMKLHRQIEQHGMWRERTDSPFVKAKEASRTDALIRASPTRLVPGGERGQHILMQ